MIPVECIERTEPLERVYIFPVTNFLDRVSVSMKKSAVANHMLALQDNAIYKPYRLPCQHMARGLKTYYRPIVRRLPHHNSALYGLLGLSWTVADNQHLVTQSPVKTVFLQGVKGSCPAASTQLYTCFLQATTQRYNSHVYCAME